MIATKVRRASVLRMPAKWPRRRSKTFPGRLGVLARRARESRLGDDEEQRAKRVLYQRAKANRLAWPLFRELRAEGKCAEFLARHPLGGGRHGRGYVYVLKDAEGVVLYVGKAVDVVSRIYIGPQAHRWTKEWFGEVTHVTVYTYKTADYDEAERWKIQDLKPLYNKARPKPRRETEPNPIKTETNEVGHYLR